MTVTSKKNKRRKLDVPANENAVGEKNSHFWKMHEDME